MGIVIMAADDNVSTLPKAIVLLLRCDAPTRLTCHGEGRFESPDGYIGAHAAAMAKGWLERQDPQVRMWVCPECSGKRA